MLRYLFGAGVLVTVYLTMPLDGERWWLALIISLVVLVGIVPFAYRRVTAVESSESPVMAAAQAILTVAGMVVFAFSSLYVVVNRHGGEMVGLNTRLDSIYFTVTTLVTVGYGDIHATGQLARGVVTAQMVFDVSLLAMSVRLLSNAARKRVEARDSV
jgi:hypothetical protein